MDATRLLSSLLGGVLDTRPKRHDRVARFLGGSSSSLWNARTLLTAGSLGWAAYEIYRTRAGSGAQGATTTFPGQTVVSGTTIVPSPAAAPPADGLRSPPPLPPAGAAPALGLAPDGGGVEPVRRLVGVLLAAARADGELGEAEYGRLTKIAQDAGGAALVGAELRDPTPLERLVAGIPEPRAREDLYRLAFGVVRCDEGVDAAERTWLAKLAGLLALDAASTARLEREVVAGIAAS